MPVASQILLQFPAAGTSIASPAVPRGWGVSQRMPPAREISLTLPVIALS